ncbi:MAG: methyltransferase domain-containing protein [Desulfamplus sp.]|nr:methyltransferase domain-containing protein [Desulfamplus sp.]
MLNLGCGSRFHPAWINLNFSSTGSGVIPYNLKHPLPFKKNTFDVVYHSHLLEHFSKYYAKIFMKECFQVTKPGGIIRVVVPDFEQIAILYLDLLKGALRGDKEAQNRYNWIQLELFDQMVRTKSGGEMFEYWKQNPMPAEDFVIERCGSEVLNALKYLRNPANALEINGDGNNMNEEHDLMKITQFRMIGEIHQWMYDRYSLMILLENSGFNDVKVCKADESSIPDFNSFLLDIEPNGSVRRPESLFMEARK